MIKSVVAALVAASSLPAGAQAQVITRSYTATGIFPPGQPLASVAANFSLTYDPMASVDALTPNSFSSNGGQGFAGPAGFSLTYSPTPSGSLAYVGGLLNGVPLVITATNDFYIQFRLDGAGNVIPGDATIAYALSNQPGGFVRHGRSLLLTQSGAQFPSPPPGE